MYWNNKYNKYHNNKVVLNGVKYDSRKEANRGMELEFLERIGQIKDLQKQVAFTLQEKYTNNKGEHIRAINYVADFVYERDGKKYVEDTKGVRTEVFNIKKKMFEYKYPEYIFIIS